MVKVQKAWFLIAALVAVVSVFMNAPESVAQTVAGRILGTIRDSQGAVIPLAPGKMWVELVPMSVHITVS